jgi:hypothetical protein
MLRDNNLSSILIAEMDIRNTTAKESIVIPTNVDPQIIDSLGEALIAGEHVAG